MRWRQGLLAVLSLAALCAGPAPSASAFHEGGVGYCDGCHDLHGAGGQGPSMLLGSDASSTCLRCHADPGAPHNILSGDGSSYTPGGDFYWLTRSFGWQEDGRLRTSPGDSHGHNVVAADYHLSADGRLTHAPGGDYPAQSLGCVSCHDPHGQPTGSGPSPLPISQSGSYSGAAPAGTLAGSFRLLAGKAYGRSGTAFVNDPPVAVAPLPWRESDTHHVDYGSGMSEWCLNCHASIHSGASTQHPTGEEALLTAATAEAYGAYLRTGDFTGNPDSSYWALVPFERGEVDAALLDPGSTRGPEPGVSRVMCLTCHRAHASAFRSIGRWDFDSTFLADSHPAPGDDGAGATDVENSYYGRDLEAELGPFQRSLCNKCHVAD